MAVAPPLVRCTDVSEVAGRAPVPPLQAEYLRRTTESRRSAPVRPSLDPAVLRTLRRALVIMASMRLRQKALEAMKEDSFI